MFQRPLLQNPDLNFYNAFSSCKYLLRGNTELNPIHRQCRRAVLFLFAAAKDGARDIATAAGLCCPALGLERRIRPGLSRSFDCQRSLNEKLRVFLPESDFHLLRLYYVTSDRRTPFIPFTAVKHGADGRGARFLRSLPRLYAGNYRCCKFVFHLYIYYPELAEIFPKKRKNFSRGRRVSENQDTLPHRFAENRPAPKLRTAARNRTVNTRDLRSLCVSLKWLPSQVPPLPNPS